MPSGTKRKLSYSGALSEAPAKKVKRTVKAKEPSASGKKSTEGKPGKKSTEGKPGKKSTEGKPGKKSTEGKTAAMPGKAKTVVKRTSQPDKDISKKKGSVSGKSKKDVPEKKSQKKSYTKQIAQDAEKLEDIEFTAKLPTKNKKGEYLFEDWKEFRPNMSPKEVLKAGSFGGTYFRPIYSSISKQQYSGVWKELPKDWLEDLNIGKQVSSSSYHIEVNTYKAKCGGSLEMWESSGWMHPQDPYGWFQWYCRFFQGRRTEDDERQVGRWLRCAGVKGRWRNNLIAKCVRSGCAFDNAAVSPVVRQTLQHWAYKLNKEDHDAYAKKVK